MRTCEVDPPAPGDEANGLARIAHMMFRAGELPLAQAAAERMAQLPDLDPSLRAEEFLIRAFVHRVRLEDEEALDMASRALALLDAERHPRLWNRTIIRLAAILGRMGRLEEARQLPVAQAEGAGCISRCTMLVATYQFELALEALPRAAKWCAAAQNRAHARWCQGRIVEAREALEKAVGTHREEMMSESNRALLALAERDVPAFIDRLRAIRGEFEECGDPRLRVVLGILSPVMAIVDRDERHWMAALATVEDLISRRVEAFEAAWVLEQAAGIGAAYPRRAQMALERAAVAWDELGRAPEAERCRVEAATLRVQGARGE